jgi:hypothetical protein
MALDDVDPAVMPLLGESIAILYYIWHMLIAYIQSRSIGYFEIPP